MPTQTVGDFRIDRVVEDEGPFGELSFLLPEVTPELVARNADWLRPRYVDGQDRVMMSFHSFVLRTGRHTILIDSCAGNDKERPLRPYWHHQDKPYMAALAAAGVTPEQVDFVFCTHLHADHVGWNTRLQDGRWVPTFPNARYLFARTEYAYWEKEHREALARGEDAPNHGAFGDSVLPVVEAGRAVMVGSDHQIEDGVHLEAAHGHTPGACLLHAKHRGEHAVFIGDAMHTPVQLAQPSLSSRFCVDPAASTRVRESLCHHYADTATTILAGHFPGPTAGRILSHGGAFRFAMHGE